MEEVRLKLFQNLCCEYKISERIKSFISTFTALWKRMVLQGFFGKCSGSIQNYKENVL